MKNRKSDKVLKFFNNSRNFTPHGLRGLSKVRDFVSVRRDVDDVQTKLIKLQEKQIKDLRDLAYTLQEICTLTCKMVS